MNTAQCGNRYKDQRELGMATNEKSVRIDVGASSKDTVSTDPQSSSAVYVLCLRMDKYSPVAQFFILTFGIFFFYLIYGFFQELIFKLDGFRPYGMYLTLLQFAFYTAFSFCERSISKEETRKIPMKTYVLIAALTVGKMGFSNSSVGYLNYPTQAIFNIPPHSNVGTHPTIPIKTYVLIAALTVGTMGFSNSSVGYLNYPTQVIFKCCKLIPVLIMGIFIQGKKYSWIDFVACLCMSLGLIFFTLADSTVQPTFNMFGVLLISLALCSDALIGNVQEKAMKQHGSSNSEMVFYSYGIGFFMILLFEVATKQLFSAVTFSIVHPVETFGYAFFFSLSGYLGVNFVLSLIKSTGVLLAVTVTTCRKAVTIILSFIIFSKPFTVTYIWSGLIVVAGIYLNVYSKNKAKIDETLLQLYHKQIRGRGRVTVLESQRIV